MLNVRPNIQQGGGMSNDGNFFSKIYFISEYFFDFSSVSLLAFYTPHKPPAFPSAYLNTLHPSPDSTSHGDHFFDQIVVHREAAGQLNTIYFQSLATSPSDLGVFPLY